MPDRTNRSDVRRDEQVDRAPRHAPPQGWRPRTGADPSGADPAVALPSVAGKIYFPWLANRCLSRARPRRGAGCLIRADAQTYRVLSSRGELLGQRRQ